MTEKTGVTEQTSGSREERFQHWYLGSLGPHLRPVLAIALLASVLAMFVHALLFPAEIWLGSLFFIGGFISVPLLLALVGTQVQISRQHVTNFSTAICLSALFGVNGVLAWSYSHSYDMPYEGVLAITVCIGMFSTLPLRRVLPITILGSLMFAGVKVQYSMDPALIILVQVFFVLFFSAISCLIAYLVQQFFRSEYRRQQALRQLSETDPLTDLLNRRGFETRYGLANRSALRNGKMLGLILVDVDHFKAFNDNYGHDAGDNALVAIAEVLEQYARRPFDACARLGGEEFCLLLHDLDMKALQNIGQAVCHAVAHLKIPHAHSSAGRVLTVSMGITGISPGTPFQSAYRTADRALYEAKDKGRNRWVWLSNDSKSGAGVKAAQ